MCPHPVKAHYCRLDKDKLAAAKSEFLAMEQHGIVTCEELEEQLGLSPPHDVEEEWHMGAMRGLQAAQPGHQARPVTSTAHRGPVHQAGGHEDVLQHRPQEGKLAGASGGCQVSKTAFITPL